MSLPNLEELLESLQLGLIVEEELTDEEYVALFGSSRAEQDNRNLTPR